MGRWFPCAGAPRTQDLFVPGLGGWSAGYALRFRLQRVMTRAVKASPATRPSFLCAGHASRGISLAAPPRLHPFDEHNFRWAVPADRQHGPPESAVDEIGRAHV